MATLEVEECDTSSKASDKQNLLIVIRIHREDDGTEVREELVNFNGLTLMSSLKTKDCYVIDTHEDIGLLVWMGAESELDLCEKAARKAELYLREGYYDDTTPIKYVDEEAVILPLEAPTLSDFFYFMKVKSGAVREVDKVECTEFGPREIGDSSSKYLFLDRSFVIFEVPENKAVILSNYPIITKISIDSLDTDRVVLRAPGAKDLVLRLSQIATENTPKLPVKNYYMEFEALDCGDEVAKWLSKYFGHEDKITHRMGYFDEDLTERSDMIKSTLDQTGFSSVQEYKHWRKSDSGAFSHLSSYHLLGLASVNDVNTRLAPEHQTTYLNYRPNIVVDNCKEYAEDNWTWIKIGDKVVLRTVKPTTRCPTVLVDPRTGEINKKTEPMRAMKRYRTMNQLYRRKVQGGKPCLGLNLGLYEIGEIHVGDPVYVGV